VTRIPLKLLTWSYDDEANRVIAEFAENPGPDETDPARFLPELFFTVQLAPLISEMEARPVPPPPPPEPPTDEG
jgi:hypothetical protein